MNTEEEIRELWEDQTHYSEPKRCPTCGSKTLVHVTNGEDGYVACWNNACAFIDDTHDEDNFDVQYWSRAHRGFVEMFVDSVYGDISRGPSSYAKINTVLDGRGEIIG